MSRSLSFLLPLLVIVLASCQSESELGPHVDAWKPTTVTYDPICKGDDCETIVTIKPGHGGGPLLPMVYNPKLDDPIAQWGDCLDTIMSCRRNGGSTLSCIETSSCPKACVEKYSSLAQKVSAEKGRTDLFKRFFVDDGGPCVPLEGGAR